MAPPGNRNQKPQGQASGKGNAHSGYLTPSGSGGQASGKEKAHSGFLTASGSGGQASGKGKAHSGYLTPSGSGGQASGKGKTHSGYLTASGSGGPASGKGKAHSGPLPPSGSGVRKRKRNCGPLITLSSPGVEDKAKAALGHSSGSSLEEYLPVYSQLQPVPDPKLLLKLPKCPRPSKMISWTVEQYAQYDEFLLAKWKHFGFSPDDRAYVTIRDPDSLVVDIARLVYKARFVKQA